VEPTVATAGLLLLHTPPVVVVPSDVVAPAHTLAVPVMDDGKGLTVTTIVALHVPKVYVITAIPAFIPFTIPVTEPTVATLVLLLVHVPPTIPFTSVDVEPMHRFVEPEIDVGVGTTVNAFVAIQPELNV